VDEHRQNDSNFLLQLEKLGVSGDLGDGPVRLPTSTT
jgi:hypothetical protein